MILEPIDQLGTPGYLLIWLTLCQPRSMFRCMRLVILLVNCMFTTTSRTIILITTTIILTTIIRIMVMLRKHTIMTNKSTIGLMTTDIPITMAQMKGFWKTQRNHQNTTWQMFIRC